jgi:hypothetical protein
MNVLVTVLKGVLIIEGLFFLQGSLSLNKEKDKLNKLNKI